MTQEEISSLEQILEYHFQNPQILEIALTHRSKLNEPGVNQTYERLEFLGDAILEMLISEYLFNTHQDKQEGFLTAARSATVRTESLSKLAQTLNLGSFIQLSKGEEATGGRQNPSTLEDIIESLIGAIYSDGGLAPTQNFFNKYIIPLADSAVSENRLKDSKSTLQELIQSKGMPTPIYTIVSEIGPDHDKTFEAQVSIDNKPIATGIGKNKQDAEQKAAQKALELI